MDVPDSDWFCLSLALSAQVLAAQPALGKLNQIYFGVWLRGFNSKLMKINPTLTRKPAHTDSGKGAPDIHSHLPVSTATCQGPPCKTPSRIHSKLS
ncbi:hypothetical protein PtB15_10B244 [Puccinia triticina]|nr:hypothetical protein PtB15_10B244 [Puccinia triticina]